MTIFKAFKEVRPELPEKLATLKKQIARPGDLTKSCLIIEKGRRVLGWVPETDLQKGIRETLKWRLNIP